MFANKIVDVTLLTDYGISYLYTTLASPEAVKKNKLVTQQRSMLVCMIFKTN
jgi:hypothetical protein